MAFVKIVAYSTKYSQAVTHPSTNSAQCCLTTVIRQELVYSTWYGRRHLKEQPETIYRLEFDGEYPTKNAGCLCKNSAFLLA